MWPAHFIPFSVYPPFVPPRFPFIGSLIDQIWFSSLPPLSFVGQICVPVSSHSSLPPFLIIPCCIEESPWRSTPKGAGTALPHILTTVFNFSTVQATSALLLLALFNGPWLLTMFEGEISHCPNENQSAGGCGMWWLQAPRQHNTTNRSFRSIRFNWRHVYTSTRYLLNPEEVEHCLYEGVG